MTTAMKRKTEVELRSFDPRAVSRKLSIDLVGPVGNILGNKIATDTVYKIIEMTVSATLEQVAATRRRYSKENDRAPGRTVKGLAPTTVLPALPIEDLKPNAVIEQGLVQMSLSQLYRAAADGRFYCSMPRGRSNGKLFPAWQFVDPVPEVLPQVLRLLKEKGERYVHARMVSGEEELNELSPAEVLAGRPFSARTVKLEPAQTALLKLTAPERLALVKELFEEPSREDAIG